MSLDPARLQALTFDCYGTLIDWEAGILHAVRGVLADHGAVRSDASILAAYAEAERAAQAGPFRSYREVLREVMRRMAREWAITLAVRHVDALVESLPNWPPFEDTVAALRRLQTRYRLGVISNIDDDLFAKTARMLGTDFDWIVTAQQVGSYKPAARNFEVALERLGTDGVPHDAVLHVAQSLYHDHRPAQALGLTSAWINRYPSSSARGGAARVAPDATPDETFPDLKSLADRLGV